MAVTFIPFGYVVDLSGVLHVATTDPLWRQPQSARKLKHIPRPVRTLCGAAYDGAVARAKNHLPHTIVCYRCRKLHETNTGEAPPVAFLEEDAWPLSPF